MPTKKRKPGGPPAKPFKKGVSANPGGMTAEEKAEQARCRFDARKHKYAALDTLVAALEATKLHGPHSDEHADWPARIDAANSLLDRGFGRPAQAITDAEGNTMPTGLIILPPLDPE